MYQISNEDFRRTIRLLRSFSATRPASTRESEERRVAKLLIKKFSKKLETKKWARAGDKDNG